MICAWRALPARPPRCGQPRRLPSLDRIAWAPPGRDAPSAHLSLGVGHRGVGAARQQPRQAARQADAARHGMPGAAALLGGAGAHHQRRARAARPAMRGGPALERVQHDWGRLEGRDLARCEFGGKWCGDSWSAERAGRVRWRGCDGAFPKRGEGCRGQLLRMVARSLYSPHSQASSQQGVSGRQAGGLRSPHSKAPRARAHRQRQPS